MSPSTTIDAESSLSNMLLILIVASSTGRQQYQVVSTRRVLLRTLDRSMQPQEDLGRPVLYSMASTRRCRCDFE